MTSTTNQKKSEWWNKYQKIDFKTRNNTRNREGSSIMKTGSIHAEDIIILNVQIAWSKTERTDRRIKSIIVVGDINTPFNSLILIKLNRQE